MRTILAGIVITAVAILLVSPSTPAQNVNAIKQQLQTAVFHSGELAQRGTVIAATRQHLQHTLNCLVGSGGAGFDAAPGNPCQGQGNGAIPDLQAAVAAGVRGADKALRFAQVAQFLLVQALKMNDVNEAQPFAIVISKQLKTAFDSL